MAGKPTRTSRCDQRDARKRLAHAKQFIQVAGLVVDESGVDAEYAQAAAALAVLAGIAASDAACCAALGERSRSQKHADAAELLVKIEPGGPDVSRDFKRLIALKDQAHYGMWDVGGVHLRNCIRWAGNLVEFADRTLET